MSPRRFKDGNCSSRWHLPSRCTRPAHHCYFKHRVHTKKMVLLVKQRCSFYNAKKQPLVHTEGEPCQLATTPASTCPDSANTGNKIWRMTFGSQSWSVAGLRTHWDPTWLLSSRSYQADRKSDQLDITTLVPGFSWMCFEWNWGVFLYLKLAVSSRKQIPPIYQQCLLSGFWSNCSLEAS